MKRKILSLVITILMLFSFCSCGGSAKAEDYYEYSSEQVNSYYGDDSYLVQESVAKGESGYLQPEDERKIIYTSDIEIETLDYDSSYQSLTKAVGENGGYISSSDSYGGESYTGDRTNRRLYMTVRIPAENYSSFIASKESIGNVTSFRETTEDITSQYVDTKARIETLIAQEKRLLELIDKAESVEELLMIEDELSNVRYEIETYTSQMNTYESLLSYCTVNISLREANEFSKVNGGFGYKAKEALKSSWVMLINFLEDIAIWLIRVMPFMLLFGLIGFVIYRKIKKSINKRTHKYSEMQIINAQNIAQNSDTELTSDDK